MIVTAAAQEADLVVRRAVPGSQGGHVPSQLEFTHRRRQFQRPCQTHLGRDAGKQLVDRRRADRSSICCRSSGVLNKYDIRALSFLGTLLLIRGIIHQTRQLDSSVSLTLMIQPAS
jgi:hypothetical protein